MVGFISASGQPELFKDLVRVFREQGFSIDLKCRLHAFPIVIRIKKPVELLLRIVHEAPVLKLIWHFESEQAQVMRAEIHRVAIEPLVVLRRLEHGNLAVIVKEEHSPQELSFILRPRVNSFKEHR